MEDKTTIEVTLHGTLEDGQQFSRSLSEQDRKVLRNLYTGENADGTDFVLEIEVVGDSSFCSFLRYNLVSSTDRQGGYWGLTIKIERAYILYVDRLYSFLLKLYDSYIDDKLICGSKYVSQNFETTDLQAIENNIVAFVDRLDALRPLNVVDTINSGNTFKSNPDDISNPPLLLVDKSHI